MVNNQTKIKDILAEAAEKISKLRKKEERKRKREEDNKENNKKNSKKEPKELNKFFKKLKDAKEKDVDKFVYKGNKYKKSVASTGLTVYKKQ